MMHLGFLPPPVEGLAYSVRVQILGTGEVEIHVRPGRREDQLPDSAPSGVLEWPKEALGRVDALNLAELGCSGPSIRLAAFRERAGRPRARPRSCASAERADGRGRSSRGPLACEARLRPLLRRLGGAEFTQQASRRTRCAVTAALLCSMPTLQPAMGNFGTLARRCSKY